MSAACPPRVRVRDFSKNSCPCLRPCPRLQKKTVSISASVSAITIFKMSVSASVSADRGGYHCPRTRVSVSTDLGPSPINI